MRQLLAAAFILLLSALNHRAAAQPATALDPKLCVLTAAAASPEAPAAAPDKKAKRKAKAALDAAQSAYYKTDFPTAINALREAYAFDPSVEIFYNIAQTCREGGLTREALVLYEAVLKQNPTPEQRERAEAKITELRPKVAEAEGVLAQKALDGKQYTEASEGWQRAYGLNPLPIYLFHLAQTQYQAGRNDEAIASYEQFLARKPTGDQAREAARELGRLRAQKEDLKATAHYEKREFVQAILAWDSAYKLDSRSMYIFRKAEAMYGASQMQEAKQEYERFLQEPQQPELRELRQQAEERLVELKTPVGLSKKELAKQTEKKPVYKRWWFWTLLGGGAVAVFAVGVTAGTRQANSLGSVPSQNVRPIEP